MKKFSIPLLIGIMSIALMGIIFIQYRWIDLAVKEKQQVIDNSVYNAVEELEQQLTDHRALTFISDSLWSEMDSDFTFLDLDSGKHIIHSENSDSNVKMEVQVLTNLDTNTWPDDSKPKEHRIEQRIISTSDSISVIELEEGLGQIESVVNRMKIEFHGEHDIRLDSIQFSQKLLAAFENKGLGKIMSWGVYDKHKRQFLIAPEKQGAADYEIPLFTSDIINPGRFELRMELDHDSLIWKEIWPMIILALSFIFIILIVFLYSVKLIIRHKKISAIKSDFINNMTHEFKTPLASISLAAESLSHPKSDLTKETVSRYTDIIISEKNKLNAQVERILEVAALNKDAIVISLEKIEVNQILREAIDQFKLQREKGLVNILWENQPDFSVEANAFHLKTVLINVIDNGIKYSNDHAEISVISDPNAGTIRIKDKGIGMTKSQLDQAFNHFYRAETGNIHNTKGFGLGLSYCQLILKQMGAEISLESQFGKGTEVIIKLKRI